MTTVGIADAFGGSPARDVTFIQDYAKKAEAVGFDSLWVPEHVVFFESYESRYPYNETGTLALGSTPGVFDPFLALTAAALATTSLKVGTAVLLIGERNPLITAREAATVDQFSGGRFLLGVGVGWSHEEYAALGVPWDRRGPRCDEYIQAMKELWTAPQSTFHGEFVDFEDALAYPKPAQDPHLPVLVGGNTRPALRRAARYGDGWFGWNLTVPELEKALTDLDALLTENGRSRDGFILQVGLPHAGPAAEAAGYLRECERLGLDRMVLSTLISRRSFEAQLEEHAAALGLE